MSERCSTCRFYLGLDDGDDGEVGECRRFPPVLLTTRKHTHPDGFTQPTVWPDGWCGEYRLFVTPGTPAPAGSEPHTPGPPGPPPRGS